PTRDRGPTCRCPDATGWDSDTRCDPPTARRRLPRPVPRTGPSRRVPPETPRRLPSSELRSVSQLRPSASSLVFRARRRERPPLTHDHRHNRAYLSELCVYVPALFGIGCPLPSRYGSAFGRGRSSTEVTGGGS